MQNLGKFRGKVEISSTDTLFCWKFAVVSRKTGPAFSTHDAADTYYDAFETVITVSVNVSLG